MSAVDVSNLIVKAAAKVAKDAAGDTRKPDKQLQEALDRAALLFIALLESDEREIDESGQATGPLLIDIKTRLEVFKLAKDWFATRSRHVDDDDEKDAAHGIIGYQKQMAAAAAAKKDARPVVRGVKPPRRRDGPGRPSKAEVEQRKKYEAAVAAQESENADGDSSAMMEKLKASGYAPEGTPS